MTYFVKLEIESAKVNDYHLYHNTHPSKAYNIVKTNTLKLPLSETNASEAKFAKKMYYLSFARTPASGYIADRVRSLRLINERVLLVFDKNKLKRIRGVVISPVDYWGVNSTGRTFSGAKEAEDRLFSDDPIINFKDALLEIRAIVEEDKYANNQWLLNLYIAAKKKHIPIKLYKPTDKTGFITGKVDKAENSRLLEVLKQEGITKRKPATSEAQRSTIIKKKAPDWVSKADRGIRIVSELHYKNEKSELSDEARRFMYDYLRDKEGFLKYFQNDIQNLRAGNPVDQRRFYNVLKHSKSKTVKEFLSKTYDKWKTIWDAT